MIGRVILWSVLAALAALVAIVQTDRQAFNDPSAIAFVPPPARIVARQRLIELSSVTGKADQAMLDSSRQLVRWRPLPARNLVLFGQTAQLAGESTAFLPPLELAASRGWREPVLQVLAGQAALAEGDMDAATNRVAALIAMGTAPDQQRLLLMALMRAPDGRQSLASLLGRPGHYSVRIWRQLAAAGQPDQVIDVARRAQALGVAMDCAGINEVAERWQRRSQAVDAQHLLAQGCAADG